MMKKALLLAMTAALAISSAACSKKEEAPAATTAATTEAASTEAPAETEATEAETEEIEEDYASGEITKIDGMVLTVQIDDETAVDYDIADAEIVQEFPLSEGDLVDITFPAGSTEDPIPVLYMEVFESVIGLNTDPSAEGIVKDATMDSLTLEVDGTDYVMTKANAYVVAKEGITVGQKATVTYLGDLDDEPMAVKIVMEDSYDTPEAEESAFIGEVAQVGEEGNRIVLESAVGDFFTFVSDDIDFSGYKEGQTLQITYTGTIGAKEIPAVAVVTK